MSKSPREYKPLIRGDTIQLRIINGFDLEAADANGLSDPFIIGETVDPQLLKFDKFKTKIMKKTLSPVWNETFDLGSVKLTCGKILVKLTVMDWDRFSKDDFIGETIIEIDGSLQINRETIRDYQLEKVSTGTVKIGITVTRPEDTAQILSIAQKILRDTTHYHELLSNQNFILSCTIPGCFSSAEVKADRVTSVIAKNHETFSLQIYNLSLMSYDQERVKMVHEEVFKVGKDLTVIEKDSDITPIFATLFAAPIFEKVHLSIFKYERDTIGKTLYVYALKPKQFHMMIAMVYSTSESHISTERELLLQYVATKMNITELQHTTNQ
ncbi:predicted protein [Naegleria gruberi]|uniref:Predicted protein n=1 Tax=Naegleria gruberi TaxID=5762 RepID=D2VSY4_NAEGR|nr:uncharacterized protein NAEGRDRAFT_72104 [Naegleria gruberi]EFC39983.1 predicted protein [Naegleria gruberi]|eukprot:XP_002672727.1 predicted protein [Naegleria gruberi strain NEG-M]